MAEKNLYKVIASLVAIFAYLTVILFIITYMSQKNKTKKDYGFDVANAVVVNIDSLLDDKPKPIEKLEPKPVAKPVIKPIVLPPDPEPTPAPKVKPIILPPDPEPIILPADPEPIVEKKPEPEPVEEKESRDKEAKSAKDLFSTLRVDNYKKAMAEKRKQEAARASRLKKQKAEKARKRAAKRLARQKQRRKKEAAQQARKLVEQMQISTPSAHKKSGENHEFWSFVSNKIMSKWQRTVSTQDGLSATVTIKIDSQGKLTYSDLKSSYNSLFDTKLKVFLDNLEYERFPSYKNGSFIEAEFEFTDKEKGL